jgi:hypothetical protein
MSVTVAGFVKNGVVVPNVPLPEGAEVEIRLNDGPLEQPAERKDELAVEGAPMPPARLTPAELRRLPREKRQAILAVAAELAEQDYRCDMELTGFEAFREEELDDDDADSR